MSESRLNGGRTLGVLLGVSGVLTAAALALVAARGGPPGTPTPAPPTQLPPPGVTLSPLPGPLRLAGPLPVPRQGAAMAYDEARGEVVLFGGSLYDSGAGLGTPLDDTWVLNGRAWTRLQPPSSPPPMTGRLSMVYDDHTRRCLLVGVVAEGAGAVVAWSWDGASWAPLPRPPLAAFEIAAGLAYDRGSGDVILLARTGTGGGQLSGTHTWTWDGGGWSLQHPLTQLPAAAAQLAGLGGSGRASDGILAVMGDAAGSQTWLWHDGDWSAVAAGSEPAYDAQSATMAQDQATGMVVLIGLDPGGPTWIWDGGPWTRAGAAPSVPSLDGGTSVLSDTRIGHAIVIGDGGRPNHFDVLWTFDGSGWFSDRSA